MHEIGLKASGIPCLNDLFALPIANVGNIAWGFDRFALEPTAISIKVRSCQTDASPCFKIVINAAITLRMSKNLFSPAPAELWLEKKVLLTDSVFLRLPRVWTPKRILAWKYFVVKQDLAVLLL